MTLNKCWIFSLDGTFFRDSLKKTLKINKKMEMIEIKKAFGNPIANFKVFIPPRYDIVDGINKLGKRVSSHVLTISELGIMSIGSSKPKNFLNPGSFYRLIIMPIDVNSILINDLIKYQEERPNNIFLGGFGMLAFFLTEKYLKRIPIHHRIFCLDKKENLFQENSQSPRMVTFIHRVSHYYYEIRAMDYNNHLNRGDCVVFFSGPFER